MFITQTGREKVLLFVCSYDLNMISLGSYQIAGLREPFQPFTDVALKKLPQLQRTPWVTPAKEIKALSLFVLHSHTICHGASAAAASRNDEPISPDKTYTGCG